MLEGDAAIGRVRARCMFGLLSGEVEFEASIEGLTEVLLEG